MRASLVMEAGCKVQGQGAPGPHAAALAWPRQILLHRHGPVAHGCAPLLGEKQAPGCIERAGRPGARVSPTLHLTRAPAAFQPPSEEADSERGGNLGALTLNLGLFGWW